MTKITLQQIIKHFDCLLYYLLLVAKEIKRSCCEKSGFAQHDAILISNVSCKLKDVKRVSSNICELIN